MMGSLYTFSRGLLWRRWQPELSKLSQHFFFFFCLVGNFPINLVYGDDYIYTDWAHDRPALSSERTVHDNEHRSCLIRMKNLVMSLERDSTPRRRDQRTVGRRITWSWTYTFQSWRWMYVPPKRQYPHTKLHGVTTQTTTASTVAITKTSKHTS
jgi:hypothetical protein